MAPAQSLVSTGQSFLSAELVPGAPNDAGRLAGLKLRIEDGWKTYWRAPGDAGVPPRFDWSRSENLAAVEVLWPAPEMFESFGMRMLGYSGEVVLPLQVVPTDPAAPMRLALDLAAGVCREICLIEELTVEATMLPDTTGGLAAVSEALARLPARAPGPETGLIAAGCRLEGRGAARLVQAELTLEGPVTEPIVVIEGPPGIWIGHAVLSKEAGGLRLHAEAPVSVGEGAWIGRQDLRVTLLGADGTAAEVIGCAPS